MSQTEIGTLVHKVSLQCVVLLAKILYTARQYLTLQISIQIFGGFTMFNRQFSLVSFCIGAFSTSRWP